MPLIPPPGPHGGDGADIARSLGLELDAVLDLSMSLNPCAPDIQPIAARHLDALSRYPSDHDTARATAALAEAMGLPVDRLVLTNGGAEAIAVVAAEIGGGPWREPEFSLHPRHEEGPRWRSNPHNPTGQLAPTAPDPDVVVWDEAFYPLATGDWTRSYPHPRAVVVGSLTKLYACPGLRLGYLIAPDTMSAQQLRARQPHWSVNGLALAMLPDLLAASELRDWAEHIAARRDDLTTLLRQHGFEPLTSDANWLLVPAARHLRDHLAARAIAVRDCTSFGLPGHVRIAVPDADGLARLDGALQALTEEPPG